MPTTAQSARTQTTNTTTTAAATTAAPSSVASRVAAPSVSPARSATPAPPVMRLGGAGPSAKPVVVKQPKPFAKAGAGEPLAAGVRPALEERFGVDLSAVRVHTGADAAAAVGALSARAFTRGTDIFLGKGERATDFALLAHEVAHVVQQQGAPRVQRLSNVESDACEREAHRAADAATRGRQFDVRERTSGPALQRWGIGDALDRFADLANMIPGYRMFTIVLGVNPINMSAVERSAANIMRAVVEFLPGGGLVTRALDTYGVFERVGGWVEGQIRSLGMTGGAIRQALMDFVRSLSLSDIFDLGGVWDRARRIFTEPISRIISFARGLITGVLGFLREAVLRPLARLAQGTQGYDLLKAVLGQDPVTGEAVPRNADTLIGGFMKLIGQEEVWNNLKRANAVARAWAWFQGALEGLMGYVRQVPGLIVSTLTSIVIEDLLPLTNLFVKVGRAFGGFFGSFLSWAGAQVMSLLQIIFEVVAPGVMPYIRRAAGAFTSIIRNPVGFVGNLVRAGIQGFRQFAGNFLNHLRASLISWLTGTMSGAGVYIPQAFSVMEIIKFVLSVLGLTWQNIRGKLVRVVGETAVRALEVGFDLVVTLVTQGPAAAWQKILEGITNLREMVMEQVMTFVRDRIVQAAITQLLTSLNPAGAFIQAIFAIYNTVMFFVERVRQIAQVVAAYIDSISAIAAGNIGAAANRVETTMAGLLTLVISFLARIARLGRVSDAVVNIVNRVRAPVDRALDRVVDWIVAQARRLGRFIAQAGVPQDPNERLRLGMQAASAAADRFAGRRVGAVVLRPLLSVIRTRYGLRSLEVVPDGDRWAVEGIVNPRQITRTPVFRLDVDAANIDEGTGMTRASVEAGRTATTLITLQPFFVTHLQAMGFSAAEVQEVRENLSLYPSQASRLMSILFQEGMAHFSDRMEGYRSALRQLLRNTMIPGLYAVFVEAHRYLTMFSSSRLIFEVRAAPGAPRLDVDIAILGAHAQYSHIVQVKRIDASQIEGTLRECRRQLANLNSSHKLIVIYLNNGTVAEFDTVQIATRGGSPVTRRDQIVDFLRTYDYQVDFIFIRDGSRRVRYP
jgi:hypothetical protein